MTVCAVAPKAQPLVALMGTRAPSKYTATLFGSGGDCDIAKVQLETATLMAARAFAKSAAEVAG